MKKPAIVVSLLLVSAITGYLFWFRQPTVMRKPAMYSIPVPSRDYPPPAPAPEPESKYEKFKDEMKDWLDIGTKAVPILSFIGALIVGRRKKK